MSASDGKLSFEIRVDLKLRSYNCYLKMTEPSQSSGGVHTTSTVGLKLALTCVTALYRRITKCARIQDYRQLK
jgi:hypothetical protein